MPDIVRVGRIGRFPGRISMGDGLGRTGDRTTLAISAKAGNPEGPGLVVFHRLKICVYLADAHPRPMLGRDHLAVAGSFTQAGGNGVWGVDPQIIHGSNRLIAELSQKHRQLPGNFNRIGIAIAGRRIR